MKILKALLPLAFVGFIALPHTPSYAAEDNHLAGAINTLIDIRGDFLKELSGEKDVNKILEITGHIYRIDECIVVLHRAEAYLENKAQMEMKK